MSNHHFISYSVGDAAEFALRLCDELIAGPPPIAAWLDKRNIIPGQGWDEQIVEALKDCKSLIFVMTTDSVEDASGCKNEWLRALKYKKPIIPILLHHDAEMPFQLGNRQHIDFSDNFATGMAQLRKHIKWLSSPEGKLRALKDRLADATRDLRRATDAVKEARAEKDIETLREQIAAQENIVKNPQAAEQRVQKSIEVGIKLAQKPRKPVSGHSKTKFINPPPGIAPSYFQNRHVETGLVGDFLKDDSQRLMTVVGRAGVGKTALVCRLLKSLEAGRLPEGVGQPNSGEKLSVDGIVYLSERASQKVNFPDVFFDICQLLPKETAQALDAVYKESAIGTAAKMKALLREIPQGRYIVLLDNFEDKINPQTLSIEDKDIHDALTAVLDSEQHGLKVIITTRIAPKDLGLIEPGRQRRLDLDKGLKSPYAENILREMDFDGKVGLKDASNEVLNEARGRTQGYPRALEALFAILSADRESSLAEVLADAKKLLPEHVVEKMVGEAYSRLDEDAQMVMQALAIYGRPVTDVAVDYLLQPHVTGINSASVLSRLVNMRFVRKEATLYYLHPVDREYALGRIPMGEDGEEPNNGQIQKMVSLLPGETATPVSETGYSHNALLNRAADYFKETRLPRDDWKDLHDLEPQLAEFELRLQAGNYDTAARVLLEIDYEYLILWGHSRLVAEYHEQLQGKIEDQYVLLGSLINLGNCYSSLGDYQLAIEHYQKSLEIARETGSRRGRATVLGNLGLCYDRLGNYQLAIEYHQQDLAISQGVGDRKGEARALGNIGISHDSLGDYQLAIEHHQQDLAISQEIDDRSSEAGALGNLGNCHYMLGDYESAIDHHQQMLAISQEIGYRDGEAHALNNRACAQLFLDNSPSVQSGFQLAVEIWEETGSPDIVEPYTLWGISYLLTGNTDEARTAFAKATELASSFLEQANRVETIDLKALALSGLAVCMQDENCLQQACEVFMQAREITSAKGQVDRILKFFDFIAAHDDNQLLAGMREVAAGTQE